MNTHTATVSETAQNRVCPWWVAYFFDNPLRRLMHPADKILGDHVSKGMKVMDFGCGFGHFSLGMARLVGESGTVWAVDVQQKMLSKTMARAGKEGLEEIIQPVLCKSDRIGGPADVDFVLASNSLHETPDPATALVELFSILRSGGRFFLMEPKAHLKANGFEDEVSSALAAGFTEVMRPEISREMSVIFEKPRYPVPS